MSDKLATVQVELSFKQIAEALRQLPEGEKLALWRLLDAELDRAAIEQRLSDALHLIRITYASAQEGEVMADALKAIREVRGLRYGDQDHLVMSP